MASLGFSESLDISLNTIPLQIEDFLIPTSQPMCSILSPPLILPRDWPDNHSSLVDFCDFQSNHLDSARPSSSQLTGLGIRNLDKSKDPDSKAFGMYDVDELSGRHTLNRSHTLNRPRRTDAIYYDLDEIGISAFSQQATTICPSWSFSNSTTELVEGSLTEEHHSHFSEINIDESASLSLTNSEQDVGLSFQKMSAQTGMSLADFAAQISASAEFTLRQMTEGNMNAEVSLSTFNSPRRSLALFGDSGEASNLFLPSINENEKLGTYMDDRYLGINPSELLSCSTVLCSSPVTRSDRLFLVHPNDLELPSGISIPSTDSPDNVHGFGIDSQQVLLRHGGKPELNQTSYVAEQSGFNSPHLSEGSVFQSPSSSEYSPSMSSLGKKCSFYTNTSSRKTTRSREEAQSDAPSPEDQDKLSFRPINLGTPVFDAHRGVDLQELKAKAERYRLRNQGRDYDKRWLISFAGKLSARGELMDEFRCYVTGCKQVNKRRDHILIHVGAHLDQRPFKCKHCSSRFLRKNECKRHELSHSGVRPFSCHLCPLPQTTFVRQDLLKRHMKRTHRFDLKSEKENVDNSRPRKRARY